jgi:SAM-dependent methyltransferase
VHGFTNVDGQGDPTAWVGVLDRVAEEPFYQAYQRRVRELLRAEPGGLVLEIGAGAGTSAIALRRDYGVEVATVDRSMTMGAVMLSRGLTSVAAADAQALPFRDNSFACASADRTLQHLTDPERAVDELARVVRPGGRIVLADPDYDTQVLDIADQELARSVLRFRSDVGIRHGSLAHQHAGLLVDRGLRDVTTEAHTLVVRDPTAVDNVLGLRTWAASAAAIGYLQPAQADAFEAQFDEAVARGRFLYAVTFFLTAGTVDQAAGSS